MTARTKEAQTYRWCRIPGTYFGQQLNRGQVIPTPQADRDTLDRLNDLGYLETTDKLDTFDPDDLPECGECGAKFIRSVFRAGHVEQEHSRRVLNVRQEEEAADRLDRLIEREAPPHLENSVASRKGI